MNTLDIYYFSSTTNNTHRFVQKLDWKHGDMHRLPTRPGDEDAPVPSRPYLFVVPSYGDERRAHVPPQVRKFLNMEQNRAWCVGVVGAGNLNFGKEYAAAGVAIARKLHVPLLYKFEIAGTSVDVEEVTRLGAEMAEGVTSGAIKPHLHAKNIPSTQKSPTHR